MLMTQKGIEAMIKISKEHPNQTSPVERALRYHADSKYSSLLFLFITGQMFYSPFFIEISI